MVCQLAKLRSVIHAQGRDGIRMSSEARVRYFEEMGSLIVSIGARDYLAGDGAEPEQS